MRPKDLTNKLVILNRYAPSTVSLIQKEFYTESFVSLYKRSVWCKAWPSERKCYENPTEQGTFVLDYRIPPPEFLVWT